MVDPLRRRFTQSESRQRYGEGNGVSTSGGGGGVTVEDDASVVVSGATAINFGTGFNVSDDGDGTVSVDASGGSSSSNYTPPTSSTFPNWFSQGNAQLGISREGFFTIYLPANASLGKTHSRTKTKPSAPHGAIMGIIVQSFQGAFSWYGFNIGDSQTGEQNHFGITDQGGDVAVDVKAMSDVNSFGSNVNAQGIHPLGRYFFRFEDDGTDFIYYVSTGLGPWMELRRHSRTAYVSNPDVIGLTATVDETSALPAAVACFHYEEFAL